MKKLSNKTVAVIAACLLGISGLGIGLAIAYPPLTAIAGEDPDIDLIDGSISDCIICPLYNHEATQLTAASNRKSSHPKSASELENAESILNNNGYQYKKVIAAFDVEAVYESQDERAIDITVFIPDIADGTKYKMLCVNDDSTMNVVELEVRFNAVYFTFTDEHAKFIIFEPVDEVAAVPGSSFEFFYPVDKEETDESTDETEESEIPVIDETVDPSGDVEITIPEGTNTTPEVVQEIKENTSKKNDVVPSQITIKTSDGATVDDDGNKSGGVGVGRG